MLQILEKQYVRTVTASGGAVGAAAAAPAVGTAVSLTLTSAEVATFFSASAAYALAVAEVHGIGVEEGSRRRTLLLATVLGDQGAKAIRHQAGLDAAAWGRALLVKAPTTTIKRVNKTLAKRFVRKQVTRQGALAFGRLAPFGIGALIGATGPGDGARCGDLRPAGLRAPADALPPRHRGRRDAGGAHGGPAARRGAAPAG